MHKQRIKHRLFSSAAMILCILCGCVKKSHEPITQFAESLIAGFNADSGSARRDYSFPAPGIAWKYYYSVMDAQYELEEVEGGTYILHTVYIEFKSIDSAASPEEASHLQAFEISDSYTANTIIQNLGGEWTATTPSDVFSQKQQKWTRVNLFYSQIVTE